MQNNNKRKYPGQPQTQQQAQRMSNQVAAPAAQVVPNIPAPATNVANNVAKRTATARPSQHQQQHANNVARRAANLANPNATTRPASGGGGLQWLFTPVAIPRARGVRRGDMTPALRGLLLFFGAGLWLGGAFLTNVFMAQLFPVTAKLQLFNSSFNPAAWIATALASAIFLGMELYLWKGEHSLAVWILLLIALGADVYINCRGFMELLQFNSFRWLDEPSFCILVVGGAMAVLPEKFMSAAWE